MPIEQAIPQEAPVMIAWNNYKASDEFQNAKKWAINPDHTDGSLWAAFYAGFFACAVNAAPKMVDDHIAGLREAAEIAEAFPARTHGSLATAPYAAAEQAADEIAAAILARIAELEKL